jgi:hypothetical protein
VTLPFLHRSHFLCYRNEEDGEGDHFVRPLPRGAFAQLFPPDRQLNYLTELNLDGLDYELLHHLQFDEVG